MLLKSTSALLLAVLLVAGPGVATGSDVTDPSLPRNLPADGRVEVRWTDPAQFTEIRLSSNSHEARQGNWVWQLAQHLRDSVGKVLPAGQKLDVTITDIDLAGQYPPGAAGSAQDVRVMRDIYPPRMTLTFKRTAEDGSVIDQGDRKLADTGYLDGASPLGFDQALRFDKQLIDQWVRREVRNAKEARKETVNSAGDPG